MSRTRRSRPGISLAVINGRLRRSERGFTVMELAIVIAIAGVMTTLVMRFGLGYYRTLQRLDAEATATVEVSSIINRVARVLRGLSQIDTAQPNELIGYGYFDPNDTVPSQIHYLVSGEQLQVHTILASGTAPNFTYDPANEVVRDLLPDIVTNPEPLFRYYDDTGAELPGGFSTSQVKQIGVYIAQQPNPAVLPASVTNQTRVTLRNMKTNL